MTRTPGAVVPVPCFAFFFSFLSFPFSLPPASLFRIPRIAEYTSLFSSFSSLHLGLPLYLAYISCRELAIDWSVASAKGGTIVAALLMLMHLRRFI